MIDKIKNLEKESLVLEPSPEQRKALRKKVMDHTENFLNSLKDSLAYQHSKNNSKALLDFEISEDRRELDDLIELAGRTLDLDGINPASGGHLGYIPGGGLYSSALGDYWADITNRYSGVYFADPGAVRMENMLIRWMANLVGYPPSSLGNLASGGSIANLIAVVTAREAHAIQPEQIKNSVIYLTSQSHHCIHKALKIAGLEHIQLNYVNLDERYKMNVEHLQELIMEDKEKGYYPWMVIASAGTTDTGAIDPMDKIADIVGRHNLWLHVDAAYGGFFLLVDSVKDKFKGIGRSHSIVMDPHKGLFLPYGIGAVIIRDGEPMKKAFSYTANYMQDVVEDPDEISPADLSPELTKHFRGLRMWLPLMLHGLKPFRAALEEKILLAKYFAQQLRKIQGFQVYLDPELSVVAYRYVPENRDANAFNKQLLEAIHKDGRIFVSSTILDQKFVLRVAILVFRTHLDTIDLYLEILSEKVRELLSSKSNLE